jgi:hypothetical protein
MVERSIVFHIFLAFALDDLEKIWLATRDAGPVPGVAPSPSVPSFSLSYIKFIWQLQNAVVEGARQHSGVEEPTVSSGIP